MGSWDCWGLREQLRLKCGFCSVQTLEVHELLAEGIRSGEVVPLPVNLFERENVSDAFRFMAAGGFSPGKSSVKPHADTSPVH